MEFPSGKKLGHYEIVDAIGKGGMGEVYRARDSKLGRTGGGDRPFWAPDGKEVFYREAGTRIMAVPVDTSAGFTSALPGLVFELPELSGPERHYDVAPDGQRFVMLRDENRVSARIHFNVVLNWFEDLKRLVPTHD